MPGGSIIISMVVEISKKGRQASLLAPVFKALSDENRVAIFDLIRERCGTGCETSDAGIERTVSELAREFDLALSTVSHHLKELRNAGLVVCERRGQRVHCSVNFEMLERLEGFLGERG